MVDIYIYIYIERERETETERERREKERKREKNADREIDNKYASTSEYTDIFITYTTRKNISICTPQTSVASGVMAALLGD